MNALLVELCLQGSDFTLQADDSDLQSSEAAEKEDVENAARDLGAGVLGVPIELQQLRHLHADPCLGRQGEEELIHGVAGAGVVDLGISGRLDVGHVDTVAVEDERRERLMLDSFGGYDWGDPIVLWTWPRKPRVDFTPAQLAIAEKVLARSAVVDGDAEFSERAGHFGGPILEALDGAEQVERRLVEFKGDVFGGSSDGSSGVLRADSEVLVGAEDGLFEFGEEAGVDYGIGHGVTVAGSHGAGDAAFGGAA